MEVEGPDSVDAIDEMPDAKRRKLSSEADMDLDSMKVGSLLGVLTQLVLHVFFHVHCIW